MRDRITKTVRDLQAQELRHDQEQAKAIPDRVEFKKVLPVLPDPYSPQGDAVAGGQ